MGIIKFGVMAKTNNEIEHFHFIVETNHPHAALALKSWATYLTQGETHWIRAGKDFVFNSLSDCTGLFNVLLLIESQDQSPARMEFWEKVMYPIEFPKKSVQTATA